MGQGIQALRIALRYPIYKNVLAVQFVWLHQTFMGSNTTAHEQADLNFLIVEHSIQYILKQNVLYYIFNLY